LRGVSLGQLTTIVEIYLKGGWLKRQCEKWNADNPHAQFRQAENLYALDCHIVKPMTTPGPSPARDQDSDNFFPAAGFKCAMAQLLNPRGRFVNFFVSHWWAHPFRSTVQALQLWSKQQVIENIGDTNVSRLVFWICTFALNQHKAQEEVGHSPTSGPFNAALFHATSGAVMVVGENAGAFDRIWCIFEVFRLKELKKSFELVSDRGPLRELSGSSPENDAFLERVGAKLKTVSAIRAEASSERDRQAILCCVINKGFRKVVQKKQD